jgi:DNA polymerase III epsilon subunit-like protein
MKLLVFDTETTGLIKTSISADTLHLLPIIVQFSYIIYDTEEQDIKVSRDHIIKVPEGVIIPEESIQFHKITNEISEKKGVSLNEVLNEFFAHLRTSDTLIGHNIEFDINMIKIELLRYINNSAVLGDHLTLCKQNLHYLSNFQNVYCTLKSTIQFCNITSISKMGKPYLKFPRLVELHQKLFNTVPKNLHNSFNDILVTLRCFMKFKYEVDLLETCETFKNYAIF